MDGHRTDGQLAINDSLHYTMITERCSFVKHGYNTGVVYRHTLSAIQRICDVFQVDHTPSNDSLRRVIGYTASKPYTPSNDAAMDIRL